MTNRTIPVYSKPRCVQCNMTKDFLDRAGATYTTVDISQDLNALEAVKALGYMGAPVVIVNDNGDTRDEKHWYGFRPDLLEEFTTNQEAA